MYDNELQHYGVKGMKWGVRRAERDARKLAKLKSRGASANIQVENTRRIMDASNNSFVKGRVGKILAKQEKAALKANAKADRFAKKMVEKYKNTKLSSIAYSDPVYRNGRAFVSVGMGLAYRDDSGAPIFEISETSSSKVRRV